MRTLPRLLLPLLLTGLLVPAGAAAKASPLPRVTKVSPLKLAVGETLTVRGSGFIAGKNKTTVIFVRAGHPGVFVQAIRATTTKLSVVVPDRVATFFTKAGTPTRFRLRVIGRRAQASPTRTALAPLISPRKATAGGATGTTGATGPAAPAAPTCATVAAANPNADTDADGLANALESAVGTDPCRADTDGDGIADGYEYDAAKDLNGQSTPYPGKRPWPNPLDAGDTGFDFDGDGMSLAQEYKLWVFVGRPMNGAQLAAYSDGKQSTGGSVAAITPAQQQLDLDHDGNLTDDERDADDDGLSNQVEFNLEGTQAYWAAAFKTEKPYGIRSFSDVDPTLADTDGDGILDGQDDQDNDGYSNVTEMQLTRSEAGLRVHAFNPCLPNPYALTCSRYPPLDPASSWPPFDNSEQAYNGTMGSVVPFRFPDQTTVDQSQAWNGSGGQQGT